MDASQPMYKTKIINKILVCFFVYVLTENVDENRPVPTKEQVAALEEAIPSRSTHITLLDLNIIILAADHPPCQSTGFPMETTTGLGVIPAMYTPKSGPLPALCLQSERIDIQSTVPMYGRKLVRAVSRLPQASGNLMHHCYAHMYLKVSMLNVQCINLALTTMSL